MSAGPGSIRRCRADERDDILRIVNAAADAYRGVIPADRWQEPYMPGDELDAEVAAGVAFWGYETGAELLGVMGIQAVDDVDLIRHALDDPRAPDRDLGGPGEPAVLSLSGGVQGRWKNGSSTRTSVMWSTGWPLRVFRTSRPYVCGGERRRIGAGLRVASEHE